MYFFFLLSRNASISCFPILMSCLLPEESAMRSVDGQDLTH